MVNISWFMSLPGLERLPPAGLQDSECGAALAGDDTAWGETGGDWWMLCWRQGSIL